ncbi:probable ATP-dependent RNA helicase kurz, partial [Pempheris klunzingeri]|uniref:probable ATP-dependent RNA helicase kurz n=1 Tax=Pempheris klunzingeri TaxID=3127111 RepID=UPI0039803B02
VTNSNNSPSVNKPSYVLVKRDPKIQKSRLLLPILGEEQVIMEEISKNDIVIISGETGSGKTTQLPQFLYEAGYSNKNNPKKCMQGMIGITEPRRVAAIAMSERVGIELGFPKNECSYKIRHDGTVSANTRIKFMTDGVLIKEVENDFLLSNYSVIIIDEAHERSLHTDILLGLLSRIVIVRKKRFCPLKLIIMSATLQLEQFESNKMLFPTNIPPVIKISSRQYPVSIHFSRKTPSDYLKAAYNRICKIHRKTPTHGSILVFVTSHREL